MLLTFSKYLWPALLIALLSACAQLPKTVANHKSNPNTVNNTQQPRLEVYDNHRVTPQPPVHLQIGRYTYLAAKPKPEQLNPLLTLIDVQLPDYINTVGESVNYLLQASGYQFNPAIRPDADAVALLNHTLPDVHRHFEHVQLRDALLALCGSGFRLLVDPVHRLVAFERDPNWITP